VPLTTTDEQRAIRESILAWGARAGTIAAVRARETGMPPDNPHHRQLAAMGFFDPEGLSVLDMAVALEAAAEVLAPGPVLPTMLASIVLRDAAIGSDIASGDVTVAVAVPASPTTFLGGGEATRLLLPTGLEKAEVASLKPLDFSRSLAQGPPGMRVDDLFATLAAAEASGIAHWCVRTAADYARKRVQFGRPIGSFQAVKHICAWMHCRAEQAAAVAWDAARAADEKPNELPLAAAVAATVAIDAAVENAKDCIQVLGGIGFTWEHDAHLYLRRAVALRQLCGDGWQGRAARLAQAGARRTLRVNVGRDPELARIAALPESQRRVALSDGGYLSTPDPRLQLLVDEELSRAGATRPDLGIGAWAVPTILAAGTAELRERFAGPTLRGEIAWCQLFSEPEAGSDLASLRTRAERADGGWILNGQKVWTSLAREAGWAICLARTDSSAPKHKGMTYLLVDMRSAGIDIRPLREITGDARFNEVFLDNVFVPDDCVLGKPGDGWRLARATLANERVAMGSSLDEGVERLLRRYDDLDTLGRLVTQGLSVSLMDLRATLQRLDGHDPGAGSAVRKLVGVQHRQAVTEAALKLSGLDGATANDETHQFLLMRCLSIAGGTDQILLSLVGERILGLPRDEVG